MAFAVSVEECFVRAGVDLSCCCWNLLDVSSVSRNGFETKFRSTTARL